MYMFVVCVLVLWCESVKLALGDGQHNNTTNILIIHMCMCAYLHTHTDRQTDGRTDRQ